MWIDGNGEVNTAEETVLQTGDIAQVRYVGLITAYRTDNIPESYFRGILVPCQQSHRCRGGVAAGSGAQRVSFFYDLADLKGVSFARRRMSL